MPGGAPCRAGDREAEDPETPPCEDGLSAAPAAARKPAEATASGFPNAALSSLPDPPSAMPPHVTTPHERALCRAGCATIGLFRRGLKGLFPPSRREGVESRGSAPG